MDTNTATTTEVLQQNIRQQRQKTDNQSYASLLKKWEYHFRDRIDKILLDAHLFDFPITFEPFEKYFSGFDFQYFTFDNSDHKDLHGFYEVEDALIKIYYADNCVGSRQRFTIAHELMHVYQYFDHEFQVDIEAIISPVIRKLLIERLADKSAAYYLAPLPLMAVQAQKTCNAIQLAATFSISPRAAEICLSDYGLCT